MPRGKKPRTTTGEPGQPVAAFEGQGYGEGVVQEQLQAVLPAADHRSAEAAPPSLSRVPVPDVGAPSLADLIKQTPTGMLRGTNRPDQPVTAGLSSGPGPGREALTNLQMQTPLRRTLLTLAERTGEQMFRDLADRAGL